MEEKAEVRRATEQGPKVNIATNPLLPKKTPKKIEW